MIQHIKKHMKNTSFLGIKHNIVLFFAKKLESESFFVFLFVYFSCLAFSVLIRLIYSREV